MTKLDRISKLYEGLTNKERAALWYRHATDGNSVELARIGATVPVKTYECRDSEFTRLLLSFQFMANLCGIEHWKMRSRQGAATAFLVHHDGRKEFDEALGWEEALQFLDARLLALDRALEAVCESHGFDVDCARHIAETVPFVPRRADTVPNAEYQAEMEANLSAILNGRRH